MRLKQKNKSRYLFHFPAHARTNSGKEWSLYKNRAAGADVVMNRGRATVEYDWKIGCTHRANCFFKGTIRDILGAATTHLIYDAFGNLISGMNSLIFGYIGKVLDTATQLQNNINRWYDALIGRWLSVDLIGFEGNDTNFTAFCRNGTGYTSGFSG